MYRDLPCRKGSTCSFSRNLFGSIQLYDEFRQVMYGLLNDWEFCKSLRKISPVYESINTPDKGLCLHCDFFLQSTDYKSQKS